MSKSIKLSDEIVNLASKHAPIFSRSIPKQIEHWARVGKLAEENPELSYSTIQDQKLELDKEIKKIV